MAETDGVSSQAGTATFTHDGLDRLTNEGGTRGAPMGAIAYDNASNPTTFRGASPSYNSNNQRTGTGWVYDGNGNPTNYGSRLASFDVFDRLASLGTPPVGYTYRADGLIATRAKAVLVFDPEEGEWVEQWQPSTYFYHDGGEPVIERQSGAVTAITVRGPDGLVARKQGATWTYYTFDQQGNVSQRLNSTGTVVSSSVYDAYGAETNNGGTPTDACGYNAQWGYWFDRDTGLYLCQARWYDPSTGRWVTRDPIGYAGGANLYGYCDSTPLLVDDRSGLQVTHSRPTPVPSTKPGAVAVGGAVAVAAGTATAAIAVGALLGYGIGTAIDGQTEGRWGRWWGRSLGLRAKEFDIEKVTVKVECEDGKWRKFTLWRISSEDTEDCDEYFDRNNDRCRRIKNPRVRRLCYEYAQMLYRDCLTGG